MGMDSHYNLTPNPAFTGFNSVSSSSTDNSALQDANSTLHHSGASMFLIHPGNPVPAASVASTGGSSYHINRERTNTSTTHSTHSNYKKFASYTINSQSSEEQQNLLSRGNSSKPIISSGSGSSRRRRNGCFCCRCCSNRMGRKINCCFGTCLAICTIILLAIGAYLLATGIIILLQIYIDSEPFGLGAKLKEREEGGPDLVIAVKYIGWVVSIFGILMVIVGFSGCSGSFGRINRDHKVLGKVCLLFFILLVLIVLVITLGLTIIAIVFRDSIKNQLVSEFSKTMDLYRGERSTHPASVWWNFIQLKLECCGSDGPSDWMTNESWRSLRKDNNQSWPYVCCKWEDRDKITLHQLDLSGVNRPRYTEWEKCYRFMKPEPGSIYDKGCAAAIEELVVSNLMIVYITLASFFFLLILAIVIAVVLCRHQEFSYDFSLSPMDT